MKRIIEGKRYNTEAPRTELVGYHNNRKDYQDFSYWEAGLYKTGGGRYFLAGKGGPMSAFGRQCSDGTRTFGDRIIPLSLESAKEWSEKYLETKLEETDE